jgi:hypothetical protein
MKITNGLLLITIIGLVIMAGCLSYSRTNSNGSTIGNTASLVFTKQSLNIAPETTTLQETYADKIVGAWDIKTDNSNVIYWQFDKNGKFTGGSAPGSQEIIGNWSNFMLRNLFEINANVINSSGSSTPYNFVFYYNIYNESVLIQDPAKDRNWTFIKQS